MTWNRPRWSEASLVTRVTLLYTLLLAGVLLVVAIVVAGTLSRWIEADSLNQLSMQSQELRVALAAAAQSGEPFTITATRGLNDGLGRDGQGSGRGRDGHPIGRSHGFCLPEEKLALDSAKALVPLATRKDWVVPLAGGPGSSSLPAKPALASPDVIGKASDQVYVNLAMVKAAVMLNGSNRVAMLVTT